MRQKTKQPLIKRFVINSIIPTLLLLLLMFILNSHLIYGNAEAYSTQEVNLFTKHTALSMDRLYDTYEVAIKLLANDIALIDVDSPDYGELLREELSKMLRQETSVYCSWVILEPGVRGEGRYGVDLVRENGDIVEIYDFTDELLDNQQLSPWYNVTRNTQELFLDNIGFYDYGNGPLATSTISAPIFGEDGKFIGVLGIDILYDAFCDFLNGLQVKGSLEIMLFSKDGSMIYSGNDKYLGKSLSEIQWDSEDALKAMSIGSSYVGRSTDYYGEKSIYHLRPIQLQHQREDVYIYVDFLKSTLYQPVQYTIGRSAMLIGGVGLLLVVSLLVSLKSVSDSLSHLIYRTKRIVDGDREIQVYQYTDSKNEVDILESEFSKMTNQLIESTNTQHALAVSLEEKIRQRTADLEAMTKQAMESKEKAEEATKAKSMFLANMSHELRTPMNAIIGFLDILLYEELTPAQHKYVTDIKMASTALVEIVNDILDFSKLEAGKMELVEADFDFASMFENTVAMLTVLANEKGLECRVNRNGDIPPCIHGDEVRIKQILVNIIGNAIKYTEKGYVIYTLDIGEDKMRFEIKDSGVGIAKERMDDLFDAFSVLSTTQARTVASSGLGLSICRSLAHMMGGEVTAVSEEGRGSIFTFEMPYTLGNPESLMRISNQMRLSAPTAKVLIVDDNELNLMVASSLLELSDIQSTCVLSGKEALEELVKNEYDIVLLDHMMPDMDGVDTVKAIRQLEGEKSAIPVIALTANASKEARELLLGSGMDDFLSKPINRNRLTSTIAKWLPIEKCTVIEVEETIG